MWHRSLTGAAYMLGYGEAEYAIMTQWMGCIRVSINDRKNLARIDRTTGRML
jgi:hypothetical protein